MMKQEDVPFGPGLRASDQRTSGFMIVQETMDFITHYTICERNARRVTSNGTFETNGTAERMGQPSEWDGRANGTAEATRRFLAGDIGARCDVSASGTEVDHDVSSNNDTDIVLFRSKQ